MHINARAAAFMASLLIFVASAASAAVPTTIALEGKLVTAAGGPVADGDYDVTFALYPSATAQQPAWSETAKVKFSAGLFSHALGSVKPLDAALVDAAKAAWVGVKVGQEPELPRSPFRSVPFALRAGIADSAAALSCTACVPVSAMKFDGDIDLGGNSLKAKNASFSGDVVAKTVTATSLVGDGSKLTNVQVAGGACKTGEVVTAVKADGSVVCAKGGGGAQLPADGLSAVSNGLLTNVFDEVFASTTTPKNIPDNDPFGILDDIVVPDKGVVTSVSVQFDLTSSDVSGVKVTLLDPTNGAYVLYNGSGAGQALKGSYPDVDKPVSGDLAGWEGKNPKGKWRLQVVDSKAGPGGNDGQLNGWSISVKTLSSGMVQVKGGLTIDGALTVGGKPMPQVWTAENLALKPGETLSIDTKLGDVPLAVSAWVKVGQDWKLVTPNLAEATCPACASGVDGDFAPAKSTQLQGGRWYHFRSIKIGLGISVSASGGPLMLTSVLPVTIDGSINLNASGTKGGAGGYNAGVGAGYGKNAPDSGWPQGFSGAGGGAGFATAGTAGQMNNNSAGNTYEPAAIYGVLVGGSGGGKGGGWAFNKDKGLKGGLGGGGGGAGILIAPAIVVSATGNISANGAGGGCGSWGYCGSSCGAGASGGGGGGSGGHLWLRARSMTILGSVSAVGGKGGKPCPDTPAGQQVSVGGDGSDGFIYLDAQALDVQGSVTPKWTSVSLNGLGASDTSGLDMSMVAGVAKVLNAGATTKAVRIVVVR